MTFIDKENLIITEKNGGLVKINIISKKITKIKHTIKSIPFTGNDQVAFLMFYIMMGIYIFPIAMSLKK